MTAFERYRKEVVKKSIVIPIAVALVVSILYLAALPFIETLLPNASRDGQTAPTAQVQEVEDEQQ